MQAVSEQDLLSAVQAQLVRSYTNPSNSSKDNASLGPFRDILCLCDLEMSVKNAALLKEFLGDLPDPLQSIIAPLKASIVSLYGTESIIQVTDPLITAKTVPASTKIGAVPVAISEVPSSNASKSESAGPNSDKLQDRVESDPNKTSKAGGTTQVIHRETRSQTRVRLAKEALALAEAQTDESDHEDAHPPNLAHAPHPTLSSDTSQEVDEEERLRVSEDVSALIAEANAAQQGKAEEPSKPYARNSFSVIDRAGDLVRTVDLEHDYDHDFKRHFTGMTELYLEQLIWAPYFSVGLTPDGLIPPRSNRKDRELFAARKYFQSRTAEVSKNDLLDEESKSMEARGFLQEQQLAVNEIIERYSKQAQVTVVTAPTPLVPPVVAESLKGKMLRDLKGSEWKIADNIHKHFRYNLHEDQLKFVQAASDSLAFTEIYFDLVKRAVAQLQRYRIKMQTYLEDEFFIGRGTPLMAHLYALERFMTWIHLATNRSFKLESFEMTKILRNSIRWDSRFKEVYGLHKLVCIKPGDQLSKYEDFRQFIYQTEEEEKLNSRTQKGKSSNNLQSNSSTVSTGQGRQHRRDDRSRAQSPARPRQDYRLSKSPPQKAHYVQQDFRPPRTNDRNQASNPGNPQGILKKDDRNRPNQSSGNEDRRSRSPMGRGRGTHNKSGGRSRGGRGGRDNRHEQSQERKNVNFGRPPTPPPHQQRRDSSTADGAERAQQGFKTALEAGSRPPSTQPKPDYKYGGGNKSNKPQSFHHLTVRPDDDDGDSSSEDDGWGPRKGPRRGAKQNFAFMVRTLSERYNSGESEEDSEADGKVQSASRDLDMEIESAQDADQPMAMDIDNSVDDVTPPVNNRDVVTSFDHSLPPPTNYMVNLSDNNRLNDDLCDERVRYITRSGLLSTPERSPHESPVDRRLDTRLSSQTRSDSSLRDAGHASPFINTLICDESSVDPVDQVSTGSMGAFHLRPLKEKKVRRSLIEVLASSSNNAEQTSTDPVGPSYQEEIDPRVTNNSIMQHWQFMQDLQNIRRQDTIPGECPPPPDLISPEWLSPEPTSPAAALSIEEMEAIDVDVLMGTIAASLLPIHDGDYNDVPPEVIAESIALAAQNAGHTDFGVETDDYMHELPPLESTIDGSLNNAPMASRTQAANEVRSTRSSPMVMHDSEPDDPFSDIDVMSDHGSVHSHQGQHSSDEMVADADSTAMQADDDTVFMLDDLRDQEWIDYEQSKGKKIPSKIRSMTSSTLGFPGSKLPFDGDEDIPPDGLEFDTSIPTSDLVIHYSEQDPDYRNDESLNPLSINWVFEECFRGNYGQPDGEGEMQDVAWLKAVVEEQLLPGQDEYILESSLEHVDQPYTPDDSNPGGTSGTDTWHASGYAPGTILLLQRQAPVRPTHLRHAVACYRRAGYLQPNDPLKNNVYQTIEDRGHPQMQFDSAAHMVLLTWRHIAVPRIIMSLNEVTFLKFLHCRFDSVDAQAVADFIRIIQSARIIPATKDYLLNCVAALIRYSHLDFDDPKHDLRGKIIPLALQDVRSSYGGPFETYFYLPRRSDSRHPRILGKTSPATLRETIHELEDVLNTILVGGIGDSTSHGEHSPLQLASGELMIHIVTRLVHAAQHITHIFSRRFGGIRYTFGSRYYESERDKPDHRHRFRPGDPPNYPTLKRSREDDDDEGDTDYGHTGPGGGSRGALAAPPERTHNPRMASGADHKTHQASGGTFPGGKSRSMEAPATWSKDQYGDLPLVRVEHHHHDRNLPEIEPLDGTLVLKEEFGETLHPTVVCRQALAFMSAAGILTADEDARDRAKALIAGWYGTLTSGAQTPVPLMSLVFDIRCDITNWKSESPTIKPHASLYKFAPKNHAHELRPLPSYSRRRSVTTHRDAAVAREYQAALHGRGEDGGNPWYHARQLSSLYDNMSQSEMFSRLNDPSSFDPRGVGHKETPSRQAHRAAYLERVAQRKQLWRDQQTGPVKQRQRTFNARKWKQRLHMVHRARQAHEKTGSRTRKKEKFLFGCKGDPDDLLLDFGASITMFKHADWPDIVSCFEHVEDIRMGNSEQEHHIIKSTHKIVFISGLVALVVPELGSNIVSEGDLTRLGWDVHRYKSGDCMITDANADGTEYIVALAKRTGENMWPMADLEVLRYNRASRIEMEKTGSYSQPVTASRFRQRQRRHSLASKSGGASTLSSSNNRKDGYFSDNDVKEGDLHTSEAPGHSLGSNKQARAPSLWTQEAVSKEEKEEYCSRQLVNLLSNPTLKGRYELHRPLALRRDRKTNPLQAIHDRCGHPPKDAIKQMLSGGACIGVGAKWEDIKQHTINCRECRLATMTRLPSQPSTRDTSELEPFEEVNMDIVGQFRVLSRKGGRYVLLFVDSASFWIVIYECSKKSEVLEILQGFVTEHVQATQHVLRTLRGDFDPNFTDVDVLGWCYRNHIKARFSAPYHHQGNGRAERTVRKVLDLARTLMISAGSPPKSFTFLYLQMAVWYLNRRPLERLKWKTPYQAVHGRPPDLSKCVPADAIGYALIYDEEAKREKMDPKAVEVTLAGYPEDVEGYYVRFPTGRIMIRRDVIFDESERPSRLTNRYLGADINEDELRAYEENSERALMEEFSGNMDGKDTGEYTPTPAAVEKTATDPVIIPLDGNAYGLHRNFAPLFEESLTDEDLSQQAQAPLVLGELAPQSPKPQQVRKRQEAASASPHKYGTRTATGTPRRLRAMMLQQLAAEPMLPPTPRNLREALHKDNPHRQLWLQATYDEVNALFERGVFVRVTDDLMSNEQKKRSFDSKFVFKIKKNPEGLKFKVRLVARGFTMIAGVDYDSTFAPTIDFSVILIVLHIAATQGYQISGVDIGNAYCEALADRDNLVMKLPVDFACFGLRGNFDQRKTVEDVYVRLAHNLYGTPQGAMLWYRLLCKVLTEGGFQRLETEPCCFTNSSRRPDETIGMIILCVYVDDILVITETAAGMTWFKSWIASQFTKITDLGGMQKYLGMQIKRLEGGIGLELSQKAYIQEIAKEFKVNKKYASPLPVDLDRFLDLKPDGTESLLKILGKLRFLADRTRPDISFACSFLARFAIAPNAEHRKLAIRVVGYLLDTVDETMIIGSCKGEIKLSASADASFIRGGESKGQIGYSLFLSDDSAAIHTKSQKDKNVSISSFHAEVNALVEVIKYILWARELLAELGFKQMEPTVIDQDNTGVIDAVSKMGNDSRTRYLINKLNFAREQVLEGSVAVQYTNTTIQTSDGSTKALARIQQAIYTAGLLQGKAGAREEKKSSEQQVAAVAKVMEAAVHLTVQACYTGRCPSTDMALVEREEDIEVDGMRDKELRSRPDMATAHAVSLKQQQLKTDREERNTMEYSSGAEALRAEHNTNQHDGFPSVGQFERSPLLDAANVRTVGACKGNDNHADAEQSTEESDVLRVVSSL